MLTNTPHFAKKLKKIHICLKKGQLLCVFMIK